VPLAPCTDVRGLANLRDALPSHRPQLLALLTERTDRRLHPLPWALPIPLRAHGRYSRTESATWPSVPPCSTGTACAPQTGQRHRTVPVPRLCSRRQP
jgi:hypothetical protein